MIFNEYVYERPNIEEILAKYDAITQAVINSKDVNEVKALIDDINKVKNKFDTMANLVFIRNSINVNEEFYANEKDFLDEKTPHISAKSVKYQKALVFHPLRKELEAIYGSHWFKLMEVSLKSFDDCIIEESIKENQLTTAYAKLKASAKIEYKGEVYNLAQMAKFGSSTDRNIRREAAICTQQYYVKNKAEFDRIYDELVTVRTQMAKKMGYENYVDFGYARLSRTDYDAKMVATYRKQVLEEMVPVATRIYADQAKRIDVADPKTYDYSLEFLDGNPTPKGDSKELTAKALKMYSEMSPETKEFFEFMMSHQLLDLDTKPGKDLGGYTTFIADYKSPFIFANFNGTSADVDVLTHEAGHAFQVYQASKCIDNIDLVWPTMEACEIHSMSMEFFAYPWMESFFGDDTKKYKYSHMSSTLTFIPYGVAVDEFQHFVYENPTCGPQARRDEWKALEKKYLPWINHGELECFADGGYWFRQSHIFESPFYYIDYTLAQVCAIEFYLNSLDNPKKTWDTYVKLCKLGGSKSFLELLKEVDIPNPFMDGTIKEIAVRLKKVIGDSPF